MSIKEKEIFYNNHIHIVEVKSTITEITILLERFNNGFELAEENINYLEDRPMEIMQPEEQREKRMEKS